MALSTKLSQQQEVTYGQAIIHICIHGGVFQLVELWTGLVSTTFPQLESNLARRSSKVEPTTTVAQSPVVALKVAVYDALCCFGAVTFERLPV